MTEEFQVEPPRLYRRPKTVRGLPYGKLTKAKQVFEGSQERAVHLVFDLEGDYKAQWEAIQSIAEKIGCCAETLRKWVRQAEKDQGGARAVVWRRSDGGGRP
jgi:hypothetical protein